MRKSCRSPVLSGVGVGGDDDGAFLGERRDFSFFVNAVAPVRQRGVGEVDVGRRGVEVLRVSDGRGGVEGGDRAELVPVA